MLHISKLSFWKLLAGIFSGASQGFDFTSGINPTKGSSPLNFSRGTNAMMYRKNDAWLVYAPNNLVWPSNDFSSARYSKTTVSVALAPIAPPSGLSQCWKLTEDTSTGIHNMGGPAVTTQDGAYYTDSLYLKAGERTIAQLQMGPAVAFGGINPVVVIDLLTGNITGSTSSPTITVTDAGNGWWRLGNGKQTSGSTTISLNLIMRNSANQSSYTGDGVSGFYIAGHQVEIGPYMQAYNETVTTAYYGPRLDTNPSTLKPRGLLIEQASTNLLTYSNDFNNAAWLKTDSTVSSNNTISPEGIQNADLITEGSVGTALVSQTSAVYVAGSIVTATIRLARGNHDWIRMIIRDPVTTSDAGTVWVNLATGSLGNITNTGNATGTIAFIEALSNGFYNITLSTLVNATTTQTQILTLSAAANGSTLRSNNGQRYQYGAQIEALPYATSYIPTFAATATRSADVPIVPSAAWFQQNIGTIYAAYELAPGTNGVDMRMLTFNDGTTNNRFLFSRATNNTAQCQITIGGTTTGLGGVSTRTAGVHKQAVGYQVNDAQVAIDATLASATTPPAFPAVTQVQFGGGLGGTSGVTNLWLQQFAYYPTRLPNPQLQAMTT